MNKTFAPTIAYRIEEAPEAAEVAELYRRAGLRRPVDDLERIAKMIAHANLIICARDGIRNAHSPHAVDRSGRQREVHPDQHLA